VTGLGHLYWLYVLPELRNRKGGQTALLETIPGRDGAAAKMAGMELVTHNFRGLLCQEWILATHTGPPARHGPPRLMQFDFPDHQVNPPAQCRALG